MLAGRHWYQQYFDADTTHAATQCGIVCYVCYFVLSQAERSQYKTLNAPVLPQSCAPPVHTSCHWETTQCLPVQA